MFPSAFILPLFVVLSTVIAGVEVSENIKHRIGACVNLDLPENHAISATTNESCYQVYDAPDCTGNSKIITQKEWQTDPQDQIFSLSDCAGGNVTFYDEYRKIPGYANITLEIGSCVSFPFQINKKTSRVEMASPSCYRVYEWFGCQGPSKTIRQQDWNIWLQNKEWNDRISSVSGCHSNPPENEGTATFYDHKNRNPSYKNITLPIGPCTNLPRELDNRTSNVGMTGSCLQIYDGVDCTGNGRVITKDLFIHRDNIDWNDRISSFRGCRDTNGDYDGSVELHNGDRGSDYGNVTYGIGPCTNLTLYNNRISNAYMTGLTCYQVYDSLGCQGNIKVITQNEWNISQVDKDWNDRISSIRSCQQSKYVTFHNGDKGSVHGNITLPIGPCQNLVGSYNNAASNVESNGTCFQVYDAEDCSGDGKMVTEKDWNVQTQSPEWHDKISSFSYCMDDEEFAEDGGIVSFVTGSDTDEEGLEPQNELSCESERDCEKWAAQIKCKDKATISVRRMLCEIAMEERNSN